VIAVVEVVAAVVMHAARSVVSAGSDTTTFRVITDGGIITLIGMVGASIFKAGKLTQLVTGHDERIERLERSSDAEKVASSNGYRPRNPNEL
jgi:hypothetical protein